MGRLVCGVGENDAGYTVQPMVNGKQKTCPFYSRWYSMLSRCYSDKLKDKYQTYKGCSVAREWHRFTNFRLWMESQDWEGNDLDKDLLVPGNKIYGPDTCVFVTHNTNGFILDNTKARGEWPTGVCLSHRLALPYKAQIKVKGEKVSLGRFSTPEEAHQAWRVAKWHLAVQLAEEQTDHRVAAAILERYKV